MMESPETFARLMERMRTRCPEAARELFERYGQHIQRVVRRRLHQQLRSQLDSLDVAQAVWASFYAIPPERYTFDSPEELAGFLLHLTYTKVAQVFRKQLQTDKRSLHQEVQMPADEVAASADLNARQPTPSQVAMANERWERLLAGQPDHCRRILEMRRQGHSRREIAEQLNLHPKLIQRLLNKLEPAPEQP